MTNPAPPPESCAPGPRDPAGAAGPSRASDTRHTVDLVCATLLAVGLVGVAAFSAMGLSLGIGMSGDGCGSGCVSSDQAVAAWIISMALLVIALVVGLGGLMWAAVKRRVLSWWPVGGCLIVVVAWLAAIVILG